MNGDGLLYVINQLGMMLAQANAIIAQRDAEIAEYRAANVNVAGEETSD